MIRTKKFQVLEEDGGKKIEEEEEEKKNAIVKLSYTAIGMSQQHSLLIHEFLLCMFKINFCLFLPGGCTV